MFIKVNFFVCLLLIFFFLVKTLINKIGPWDQFKAQLCYFTYCMLLGWAFSSKLCFSHFICANHQVTSLRNIAGLM